MPRLEPKPEPKLSAPGRAGRRRSRRSRRPYRWVAVPLIVLVVLAGAGVGGWFLVVKPWTQQLEAQVVGELQLGAAQLQAGTDEVKKANADHTPAVLDDAKAKFANAQVHFANAKAFLAKDAYIKDAAGAPFIGKDYVKPRLATIDAVATMGQALGRAGEDTILVDRPLLDPGDPSASAGQRLISVLGSAGPGLAQLKTDLTSAAAAADLVNPALLPASQAQTFAKTKGQIDRGLAGIIEFQQLTPALLEILGANGARTYLIEQVDPAELRGGGGFIGSFSILQADHGNLKLVRSADVATIDKYPYPQPGSKLYIAPPNASKQFATHGWVFGDSNYYTDFPGSAQSGEQLFLNQTGTKVDGVISLDPWAVAALLQVTGPIDVPEFKTKADGNTFPEDVFQRTERDSAQSAGAARKDYFAVVANRLIEKITSIPSGSWGVLLTALNNSVQQRHLQVYFNNDSAEKEMASIFWAGAMVAPGPQPETMLEVESNYGGDKANHFLERTYDLTLSVENGKLSHHLVVNLKNSTPAGYLGGRNYSGYLRFYYPSSATGMATQGLLTNKYPNDEKLTGLQLADGWFFLELDNYKAGATSSGQYTFDYVTAPGDLAQGHSIYWQKQAGTQADKVHITFKNGGKTYTADTDLGQDRILKLSAQGLSVQAGNVPAANLPSITT
jgi:hypothetical protein